MNLGWMNLGG